MGIVDEPEPWRHDAGMAKETLLNIKCRRSLRGDLFMCVTSFFIVCLVAVRPLAASPATNWFGEWIGEIPNIGKIAIDLQDPATTSRSCKVFWVFQELGARSETEGDLLTISVSRHTVPSTVTSPAQFRLQRQSDGAVKFVPFGVITEQRFGVFAPVVFSRVSKITFQDLASYLRPGSQYERFHSGGQLQPLPTNFPTAFMDASVLLCRGLDHEQFALLKHPNLSSAVLAQITQDALDPKTGDGGALRSLPPLLAAHPNISKEDLRRLFDLPYSYDRMSPLIWRGAAMNPNAPASYRQTYLERIKNGEWRVRVWVARDREAPREAWEVAIAPKETEVLREFARNPNAPPEMLKEIAAGKGGDSVALAGNTATPANVLDDLASNPDKQVLWALLGNKSCPDSTISRALHNLTTSKSAVSRASAARDPRLDQAVFSSLMKDPSIYVRTMVAVNSAAPFEVLAALANDPYQSVSRTARENLKKRFATQLEGMKEQLKPLDSLYPYSDLNAAFADAVKNGDEIRARDLLNVTDDQETRVSVETVVGSILRNNFNRFSDMLLEVLQREGTSARNTLFFSNPNLKPESLIWAERHELLDTNSANFVWQSCVEHGNTNLLAAVMETKAGKQMSVEHKALALFRATRFRNLEMIEILLAHGADPYRIAEVVPVPLYETNGGPVKALSLGAVDLAAHNYFIAGLKRLDRNGKYRAMLVEFEKEFPSTKDSPFVGLWDNGRDGFGTSRFQLAPDATAMFGASIYGGPAVWKSSASGIELYLITPKGINREMKIVLTTNGSKNELVWKREKGESERYRMTVTGSAR